MAPSSLLPIGRLTETTRERARAEARETTAMLDYRDDEMARTAAIESPMRRQVERSAIPMAIGEATGLSEGQVQLRLCMADTVRDHSPTTWQAFVDGRIDLTRTRDIARTIDTLQRTESIHRLDARVVDYAVDHTAAELRVWLRRFVQRVEADLAVERAEDERAQRRVSVRHGDDSMAWLYAYLPSHEAAMIETRLRGAARTPADGDDDRTVAQREADQLVAWCTGSDATVSSITAHVAVMIDADVLAGVVPGFAESTDGRWAVPADWMAQVASRDNPFWHRMVVEPVTGDVLSHEYVGRFAPDVLAEALRFVHGVCQAPGCMVPAERCDNDHRVPHPEGPTTAANMGPLCRRHHILKGHHVLRWSIGPPPRPRPFVIEVRTEPVLVDYAA